MSTKATRLVNKGNKTLEVLLPLLTHSLCRALQPLTLSVGCQLDMEHVGERVCFGGLAGEAFASTPVQIPVLPVCLRPPKKARFLSPDLLRNKEEVACFGKRHDLAECEVSEPTVDLDSFRARLKPTALRMLCKEPGAELDLAVATASSNVKRGRFVVAWQFASKGCLSAPLHFEDGRCQCLTAEGTKIGACAREAFLEQLTARRLFDVSLSLQGVVA